MIIPLTYIIIGATILVSVKALSDRSLQYRFMLIPSQMSGGNGMYRLFSHALVHADYFHLFFNMFALFMFGRNADAGGAGVEMNYALYFGVWKGALFYLLLYVGGIMVSAFPSYEKHKRNTGYMSLGASGAVSAVVFSYIVMDPLAGFGLLFIPVSIPAWIFGAAYLAYSWYRAGRSADHIDHYAHFWGSVYGLIFTILIRPSFAAEFVEAIGSYFGYGF
ncbi:MAG: rhomboid family intramembrane serine protease [Bacteroidia bacterium]|nr:rhomboid family intramembrane serine protease [Bacteroidia bacterium]